MYKKTKKYRELCKRINEIEKHLVSSFVAKNVMDLSERELDLCRGYKILCHAEIEYYLEEIARIVLNESLWCWRNDKKVTLPIVGLFGNYEKIETNDSINTKINKVTNDYLVKVIKGNHGIKEDNLKKIYVNLGIDTSEFDATWIAALSSYGISRGTIAHTSATAQTPINIQEAIADTNYILNGIELFEQEVEKQTKINLYNAEKRQNL